MLKKRSFVFLFIVAIISMCGRVDLIGAEKKIICWEFNQSGSFEGWNGLKTHNIVFLEVKEGVLKGSITSSDPFMFSSSNLSMEAAEYSNIVIKMKIDNGTLAQIFWKTDQFPQFSEDRYINFPIKGDNKWHTYQVNLSSHKMWKGKIIQIRFDPSIADNGTFEIDYIRMKKQKEVVGAEKSIVNYILNPSFEIDANEDNVPDNWSYSYKQSLVNPTSWSEEFAHTGKNSVKICNDNPSLDDKSFMIWGQYHIERQIYEYQGEELECSLFAKTDVPNTQFRFYVEMMEGTKFIGTYTSGWEKVYTGWEEKKITFKLPEKRPSSIYVVLQLKSIG